MDPRIIHIVTELLKTLGVSPDTIVVEENQPTKHIIMVHSNEAAHLIGTEGECLRALNTLARKIVEIKTGSGEERFIIDVNGFHANHIKNIEENARELSKKAQIEGVPVVMPAMNAYERMIVHAALSEISEVETHSEGEGKERHVVIKARSTAATV